MMLVQQIRLFLLQHGFYFVKSKERRISRDEARAFYAEHQGTLQTT